MKVAAKSRFIIARSVGECNTGAMLINAGRVPKPAVGGCLLTAILIATIRQKIHPSTARKESSSWLFVLLSSF
jgi:hypothetical protein